MDELDEILKKILANSKSMDNEFDPRFSGGTGYSIEEAVIINATDYAEGIDSEYEFIDEDCARQGIGYALIQQRLLRRENKKYDRIDIELEDGTERSYFFDITGLMELQ